MLRRTSAFAALLFAITAVPARAQEDRKSATINFELEANLIWVDVSLDGKGPFRLAVDTGASTTVVLPDVARELGLVGEESGGGGLLGLNPEFVTVKKLHVGELVVPDIKIAVMAIPQLSLPAGLMKMKAHGVLGYNFISRFVTTFDYKKKTITLVESDYQPEDPMESLPGVRKPPRAFIGVQCDPAAGADTRLHGYDGGLRINAILENSPAEKAGLKEGDIIVDIGGSPTNRFESLQDFLRRSHSGQKVVVTFLRDGELWEVDLTIGRKKD